MEVNVILWSLHWVSVTLAIFSNSFVLSNLLQASFFSDTEYQQFLVENSDDQFEFSVSIKKTEKS